MSKENRKLLFRNFYSLRHVFLTIIFGFSFWIYELVLLPKSINFVSYLSINFSRGNYLRFLLVLSITIFAFCLFLSFIYVALASSAKFKIIYFLTFSVLILVEYGYYNALEMFFRIEELEILLYGTNWAIISDGAGYYFDFFALIPIVVFGILLIKSNKVFEPNWIPLTTLVILFSGFFFTTTYFTKNTFYVNSFSSGARVIVSFPIIWYVGTFNDSPKNDRYYTPRQEIEYRSAVNPTNNIVFIVNESIRSDHLSLNGYGVSTTPTLEKLAEKGFVKTWGTAVSGTTCSMTSNALLLTGLRDLPDTDYKIYKLPTIFQFAKAMNYKNFYFDGQLSIHWNGKVTDVLDYGEWITVNELQGDSVEKYDVDTEIARRVSKIVNNSQGNFIWITKHGIQRSPIKFYVNNETKVPEYDEAIRYNLENFFKELSSDENFGKNTIYVYTSDHGWILKEKRGIATHCQNTKEEATVPLLLISSSKNLTDADTDFKATHSNLFATLLDLMNFPKDERKYDYAISLLKAKASDSAPRFYYTGDINNVDSFEAFSFDQ